MHRRLVLATFACWPVGAWPARAEAPPPHHRISAAQLYETLSARFPRRLALGGLLEVEVSAPRLLLLPARNKLGTALQARLHGMPAQQGAAEMEIVFGLRYEPADRTLRAREPELLDLRWPGLPPETLHALQGVLPALARQLGELVLHRMTARELALPDTMGFEPGELQVTEDGVTLFFRPKPRS